MTVGCLTVKGIIIYALIGLIDTIKASIFVQLYISTLSLSIKVCNADKTSSLQ